MVIAPPSDAKLVRLDITAREVVANGMAFGDTGAYEKLTGTAYFEVDPRDPLGVEQRPEVSNRVGAPLPCGQWSTHGKMRPSAD